MSVNGYGTSCRWAAAFLAAGMVLFALTGALHVHGPDQRSGPGPRIDREQERDDGPLSCPACRFSNQQASVAEPPDGPGVAHESREASLPDPVLPPREAARSSFSSRAPPFRLLLSA